MFPHTCKNSDILGLSGEQLLSKTKHEKYLPQMLKFKRPIACFVNILNSKSGDFFTTDNNLFDGYPFRLLRRSLAKALDKIKIF